MSQVTLTIGGRKYAVACAAGEEAHVSRLGAAVDAKLAEMGGNLAPQEAQNLLFAALLIAEDLHQLRNKATGDSGEAERLREELEAAQRLRDASAGLVDQLRATIAEREQELATLQSGIQSAARESDDIRAALTRLQGDIHNAEQVEAELRAGLAGLVEERDALQQELDEARTAPASGGGTRLDPNLAPALERFAELLENCADKLEGAAQAS
jgi:cell division protein ZapA